MTGRAVLACFMGAALAGCAVGPNYRTPHTALPASFIATTAAAEGAAPVAPAVDAAQWWHALNDPQLDALIERAIRANPDIEIALTRLQEARTAQAGLTSTLLPQAGAGAGAAHGSGSDLTRGRAPEALVAGDNGARGGPIQQVVGFDAGWEIDLFGKYRREIEEAKYNTRAAAWARNAVLIAVIADVARAYVDMRGLQMRLAVTRQDVATAEQFRDLVHARYERGLTNELDVTLADRELATLQSEIAPFVSAINALQYAIAALLGDYPQALAAELAKPGLIPAIPAQVAAGLPLELLQRRPDIQQAEQQLAAASAHIGVATADLFPRLAITAGVGAENSKLGTAGISNHIWSVGPSLYWPLLDFGALDAAVNIADLQAHERLISYRRTIIDAVRDADTAIGNFSAQQERLKDLDAAMLASERAVSLASQRYDRGLTDFLNVVDAERQEYALEDEYTAGQQSAAEAFVALYKALGGGWQQYQNVPPIRRPLPAVLAIFHHVAANEESQP